MKITLRNSQILKICELLQNMEKVELPFGIAVWISNNLKVMEEKYAEIIKYIDESLSEKQQEYLKEYKRIQQSFARKLPNKQFATDNGTYIIDDEDGFNEAISELDKSYPDVFDTIKDADEKIEKYMCELSDIDNLSQIKSGDMPNELVLQANQVKHLLPLIKM